jgi:peroxiredoxin
MSSSVVRTKLPSILLWAMLPVLALSNALLIWQNLQLRAEIERYRPNLLRKGDKVEGFSAPTLRNQVINVNYTGKEATRVLLFFTPTCPFCSEQFPYWKKMLNRANANQFQIIGVVSESEDRIKIEEYLKSLGCESLSVAILPKDVSKSYKLSMTPTTMVIDNEGTVLQVWTGKWHPDDLATAESIFGFHFSQH